jgi:hypothetical protein
MATQLPDRLTYVSPDDLARALASAYRKVVGSAPNAKILGLLISQVALETGHGKMVHNFNLGNEMAVASDPFFQQYSIGDDPTAPRAKYAAFLSLEDGAEHYVRTLLRRPHWKEGLMSGNVETFVRALSTPPAYFTADPARYLKTLTGVLAMYQDEAKRYGGSAFGIIAGLSIVTLAVLGVRKLLS